MLAAITETLEEEPHKANFQQVKACLDAANEQYVSLNKLLQGLNDIRLLHMRFSPLYSPNKNLREGGYVMVGGGTDDNPQKFEVLLPNDNKKSVTFAEFEEMALRHSVSEVLIEGAKLFSKCQNIAEVEAVVLGRSGKNVFLQQHSEEIRTILQGNLKDWLEKIQTAQVQLESAEKAIIAIDKCKKTIRRLKLNGESTEEFLAQSPLIEIADFEDSLKTHRAEKASGLNNLRTIIEASRSQS